MKGGVSLNSLAPFRTAVWAPTRALPSSQWLMHYGVGVPAIRAVAKGVASARPTLGHDGVIALATALWATPVYERRLTAVELLNLYSDRLGPADGSVIEHLLRDAATWALVDGLAMHVVGRMVDRHQELGSMLDRWAGDSDFWIRRSAMLALLVALVKDKETLSASLDTRMRCSATGNSSSARRSAGCCGIRRRSGQTWSIAGCFRGHRVRQE